MQPDIHELQSMPPAPGLSAGRGIDTLWQLAVEGSNTTAASAAATKLRPHVPVKLRRPRNREEEEAEAVHTLERCRLQGPRFWQQKIVDSDDSSRQSPLL